MSECKPKKHIWWGIGPIIKAGSQMVKCSVCGKVGYKLYAQR